MKLSSIHQEKVQKQTVQGYQMGFSARWNSAIITFKFKTFKFFYAMGQSLWDENVHVFVPFAAKNEDNLDIKPIKKKKQKPPGAKYSVMSKTPLKLLQCACFYKVTLTAWLSGEFSRNITDISAWLSVLCSLLNFLPFAWWFVGLDWSLLRAGFGTHAWCLTLL